MTGAEAYADGGGWDWFSGAAEGGDGSAYVSDCEAVADLGGEEAVVAIEGRAGAASREDQAAVRNQERGTRTGPRTFRGGEWAGSRIEVEETETEAEIGQGGGWGLAEGVEQGKDCFSPSFIKKISNKNM